MSFFKGGIASHIKQVDEIRKCHMCLPDNSRSLIKNPLLALNCKRWFNYWYLLYICTVEKMVQTDAFRGHLLVMQWTASLGLTDTKRQRIEPAGLSICTQYVHWKKKYFDNNIDITLYWISWELQETFLPH